MTAITDGWGLTSLLVLIIGCTATSVRICSDRPRRLINRIRRTDVRYQETNMRCRNVFPPSHPSKVWSMPERCSPSRVRFAAPNCGAPLTAPRRSGQTVIATGGSDGTLDALLQKHGPASLPLAGKPAQFKTPSNREGLDKVAPY